MFQICKKFFTAVIIGASLCAVSVPAAATAQLFEASKQEACRGATLTSSGQDCTVGASNQADSLVETAVNLLTAIVGIVAVAVIILSGLRFVTSGGDAAKVSAAKNGVIYGFVGLILVALAQFIVRFVIDTAT